MRAITFVSPFIEEDLKAVSRQSDIPQFSEKFKKAIAEVKPKVDLDPYRHHRQFVSEGVTISCI